MPTSALERVGAGLSPDLPALKALRTSYLKDVLRSLLIFASRSPVSGSKPPLYDLLSLAIAKDSSALLEILSDPSIATLLRCFQNQESYAPEVRAVVQDRAGLIIGNLLLALSTRGFLPDEGVEWRKPRSVLSSQDLGCVLKLSAESLGWRFENGLVSALTKSGAKSYLKLSSASILGRRPSNLEISSELGYVLINRERSIRLALKDDNPIASLEAHPEKFGNALDLGGHSEEDWRSALAQNLEWIHEVWPELFEEMCFFLRRVVPVGFREPQHFSASYKEAVGVIYMTLHPNPLTMTEALIHEFQHNKINMASYFDPFLENAFLPLYKSPVRPDPRPLWGILLAVHAFFPVAAFYRKMRALNHPVSKTPDFETRLSQIDAKNHEGMETLRAHARWTPQGRVLMDELEEIENQHEKETPSVLKAGEFWE